MLKNTNDLKRLTVIAEDGEAGKVDGFYFDDKMWAVRYLVVDLGGWLLGQTVLVPTASAASPNWEQHRVEVYLSQAQIKDSPEVNSSKPWVQQENIFLSGQAGPPLDQVGGGLLDESTVGLHPDSIMETIKAKEAVAQDSQVKLQADLAHLRFADNVIGYTIQAKDGEIGQAEDFIFDDETWMVHYLVVDTDNWLPSRKVVLAPAWVERVDWAASQVYIDMTAPVIKDSPTYDPPIDRTYEERLFDHYQRQKYWTT